MSRFTQTCLPLTGLTLLKRQRSGDDRGFFSRIFCAETLRSIGWDKPISQINHTYTKKKGTVRGLHFQRPPYSEIKLVTVLCGEVWDLAVDLREESTTYLHWHAELLSKGNGRAMLVPEGFAHGFQTMTDDVELLYCHSAVYNRSAEAGLSPVDPRLNIKWPMDICELSHRDKNHPLIDQSFVGFTAL
ncbi:MAG: dTDP-4-dehydrorhamnose 3,5-epimerase [Halieaceae bacterium]|jgi:dTDP-4-dehydrorhamnose 3,5-epimerase